MVYIWSFFFTLYKQLLRKGEKHYAHTEEHNLMIEAI